jgi:adenylate kinase
MKFKTILLFGAPGSGKGTQGKTLGNIPGFFHCACGDVFRAMDTQTKIGRAFLEYSSRGELVPDEITLELWLTMLRNKVEARAYKPETDYLVLDGIPRNVNQSRLMVDMIDVRQVFHLTCPDRPELFRRLKNRALKDNRLDDANEAVIRRRLETYEAESKPVLEFYPPEIVRVIDAQQKPARVLHTILGVILDKEDRALPVDAPTAGFGEEAHHCVHEVDNHLAGLRQTAGTAVM